MVGWCRLYLSNPRCGLPGTERLKLSCDGTLSRFVFNFNLRCYRMGRASCNGSWMPRSRAVLVAQAPVIKRSGVRAVLAVLHPSPSGRV